ncbi:MAG: hypothetical protein MI924_12210 [Chloroflexales bacterium]|nr:hypothetical protein [Chloroflexales bacterium]
MHDAIARWMHDAIAQPIHWQWRGQEFTYSRQYLIWSSLKHDIHHGGELSLTLGMHGLATIE